MAGRRLALRDTRRAPVESADGLHGLEATPDGHGLRDGRLHDARHTAATVLLLLGSRSAPSWGRLGGPYTAIVARYQHMTGAVQRDVADRLGVLLWGTDESAAAGN